DWSSYVALPIWDRWVTIKVRVPTARLFHDQLHRGDVPECQLRLQRDVRGALGNQDVLPEVAEPPRSPCPPAQREKRLQQVSFLPSAEVRIAELCALEPVDLRHVDGRPVGEGASAPQRPPPATQRRGGGHRRDQLAVPFER